MASELPQSQKVSQWNITVNPDESCTAHIPKEDRMDSTIALVIMKLPKELVGPDCPDAGWITGEIRDICELLLTKNRAYGSSFAKPLGVFSKLSPVEAINARIDDKLARIKQSKDFSEDTELDLIGYLILKRIALKLEKGSPCNEGTVGHSCTGARGVPRPPDRDVRGVFISPDPNFKGTFVPTSNQQQNDDSKGDNPGDPANSAGEPGGRDCWPEDCGCVQNPGPVPPL